VALLGLADEGALEHLRAAALDFAVRNFDGGVGRAAAGRGRRGRARGDGAAAALARAARRPAQPDAVEGEGRPGPALHVRALCYRLRTLFTRLVQQVRLRAR